METMRLLDVLSKIVSALYALASLIILAIVALIMNRPWGFPADYIAVIVIFCYALGLILAFKWKGLGGFISLGCISLYLVQGIASIIRYPKNSFELEVLVTFLIIQVPVTILLTLWILERKRKNIDTNTILPPTG